MQPNGQAFFFVYVSVYFISRFRGKKNDFFDFFEREEDSSLTIIAFNSALLFYSGFPNRKLNAQVPVSYTHLDVYKRQVYSTIMVPQDIHICTFKMQAVVFDNPTTGLCRI